MGKKVIHIYTYILHLSSTSYGSVTLKMLWMWSNPDFDIYLHTCHASRATPSLVSSRSLCTCLSVHTETEKLSYRRNRYNLAQTCVMMHCRTD